MVISSRSSAPLVIAHRGGRGPDRENSIAAFVRAASLGADMVECDVRATRDGALVLVHDSTVAGRRVDTTSFRELAAGLGFQPALLGEAAAALPAQVGLDVEVKQPGCERAVLEALSGMARERLLVTSFERVTLDELRQLSSQVRLGLIVPARGQLDGAVQSAEHCGATHLVLHHRRVTPRSLAAATRAGLSVLVWTVNSKRGLRRLLQERLVRGVVTDQVELAVAVRERM